ncbi:alkaline phosphatase family protein [Gleimia hominis]|uniref:Alkaline phosphatase family protein n=1 Tax=Gleimia hominis TaxID=595468 RepID=A0ABU3IBI8_9ACTO|nr:alkaline phosphatase family protein [Gleimia hominis]MDT3767740.1 alkaline phosphatase family protein [Gleimia hominis]
MPHSRTAPLITDILPATLRSLGNPLEDNRASVVTLGQQLGLAAERGVVVVLVDGLGYRNLVDSLAHTRFLRARKEDIILGRTVLPSTTAAAITAFGTGRQPGATRMVGWSVKDGARTTVLISFEGASQPPNRWQPVPTLWERAKRCGLESAVVSDPKFAHSGLTMAALRGTRHIGARTLEQRVDTAVELANRGQKLIYLYWGQLDHAGHKYGWRSAQWLAQLEEVDSGLQRLTDRLPAGYSAVLTADHGMIDADPQQRWDLAEQPQLREGVSAIAGEGRFVHLHADRDPNGVLQRWRSALGGSARIVPKAHAPRIIGNGPGNDLIGDALVLGRGATTIVDSRHQPDGMVHLRGVHGSDSAWETDIPILRLR